MRLSTIRPFVFEEEAVKHLGEDAYFVRSMPNGFVAMGVFDGCGGIGGRRYPAVDNMTGAWIGSRITAYATETFLLKNKFRFGSDYAESLQKHITYKLKETKENIKQSGGVQIGGTLNKSLPTTVSIVTAQPTTTGDLICQYMWAGDSRGFFLDADGLCQLTTDDIDMNADDAFINLREDGILTNTANGDRDFTLNSGVIKLKGPVMLISATDGCFSYFLTPMDFENVILDTLISSDNPAQWHTSLCARIKEVTGDDYTMTIACFGFEDFRHMQMHYNNRKNFLQNEFISKQKGLSDDELKNLWLLYKKSYYRCKLNMEY